MEIKVKNLKNEEVGKVEASQEIFGAEVKEHLLHSFVKMQLTNRRRGTAAVKGRHLVSGGGKKPWAQKGTGRARAGSSRSPLWRGGGTVFGPIPKTYNSKLPKKVKKAAVRSALAMKLGNNEFMVVNEFAPSSHKTKEMLALLSGIRANREKTLLILHEKNENVFRGTRNISEVKVILPEGLNVYDLMYYKNVVCTEAALKKIQENIQ